MTILLLPLPLPYIRIITGRPEIINLRTGIIFFYEQASLIVSRAAAAMTGLEHSQKTV